MIAECRRLVRCLPNANMEVLKRLMQLLSEVSQFASINNMNTKNLAIVFAPNLFRGRDVSTMQSLKDTPFIMSVTKTLIEHRDEIFPVRLLFLLESPLQLSSPLTTATPLR